MEYTLLFVLSIVILIGPYPISLLEKRWSWWSPVLACFALGFILGNTSSWWAGNPTTQKYCKEGINMALAGSVLIAIPLFLITSDWKLFRQQLSAFLLSFVLCIVAVMMATLVAMWWFEDLEHLPIAAGALSAVYIGGTPNMAAVLYALQAPASLSGILIATDSLCSGIYFLFLVSGAKAFYKLFLPTDTVATPSTSNSASPSSTPSSPVWNWESIKPILQALMAAFCCIAFSVAIALVFPNTAGKINELILMLVLTTSSLALSFWPSLRNLAGVYDFAQYLMLIFALTIGYLVDFSSLIETGGYYLSFNGTLLALLLLFNLLLARLFRIEVNIFIITATACIMGPPFIGAVCEAIDRRSLVAPGMTLGVVGLILGTYIGVAIALVIPS